MDQHVEVRSGVRIDPAPGGQRDDVRVQIALSGLQLPYRSGRLRLGVGARRQVGGVGQDSGQWGGGELADPDPPDLATLFDVLPAVAARIIGVEFRAQAALAVGESFVLVNNHDPKQAMHSLVRCGFHNLSCVNSRA